MSATGKTARAAGILMAICIGVSIALHLVAVLMVAYIWTAPAPGSRVSYIEISELRSASPAAPVMTQPVKTGEAAGPVIQEPEEAAVAAPDPAQATRESKLVDDIRTTPLGLGMSYGFVSSLGDGATLREDIREYYLVLVEKINRVWWERAGTLSASMLQDGLAVIVLLRDGTLVDSMISRGTGSQEADQALLDSINLAAPLPALPGSYNQETFTAPLKITAPARLLRFRSAPPVTP